MSNVPLMVVGMNAEARIASRLGRVAVGAAELEAALASRPSVIISFGLCGGLDPSLAVGDLVAASAVAGTSGFPLPTDTGWTARFEQTAGAKRALVAGTARILASAADKSSLRASTGADVADMESLAIAEAAARTGIPFAVLRAVSDGAADSLPRAAVAGFRPDGQADVGAVLRGLAARPWELGGLLRTAFNARIAMRSLARAVDRLAER